MVTVVGSEPRPGEFDRTSVVTLLKHGTGSHSSVVQVPTSQYTDGHWRRQAA